jgi:hypothetical protein
MNEGMIRPKNRQQSSTRIVNEQRIARANTDICDGQYLTWAFTSSADYLKQLA